MKIAKRRLLSICLCAILIFSMAIPVGARASEYFHRTYIEATDIGSGVIRIKIDLGATETMQELGATKVIVYEKKANGTSEPVRTYTRENTPSLITYNRASYVTYVTYYGSSAKSYYAICSFYAKNSNGAQILWGSSNAT